MLSLTQTPSLKGFNPNTEPGFFFSFHGKENEGLILGNPRRVSTFCYQLQCHRELSHVAEAMLTAGHFQGPPGMWGFGNWQSGKCRALGLCSLPRELLSHSDDISSRAFPQNGHS